MTVSRDEFVVPKERTVEAAQYYVLKDREDGYSGMSGNTRGEIIDAFSSLQKSLDDYEKKFIDHSAYELFLSTLLPMLLNINYRYVVENLEALREFLDAGMSPQMICAFHIVIAETGISETSSCWISQTKDTLLSANEEMDFDAISDAPLDMFIELLRDRIVEALTDVEER